MCFTESLEDVMSVVSGLYTDLTKSLIDSCYDDIDFVLTSVGHKNHLVRLLSFVTVSQQRITFDIPAMSIEQLNVFC